MWVVVLVTCVKLSPTNFILLAGMAIFVQDTNRASADTNTSTWSQILHPQINDNEILYGALSVCHFVQRSTSLTKAEAVSRIATLAHASELTHASLLDQGEARQYAPLR